jgi:FAD/FMN-containing dehydrogenase
MRRRDLLGLVVGVPLLASPGLAAPAPRRRVRPTDAAWPSPAEWERLRRYVDGALIQPEPLLAPCESDPKSADCRDLLRALQNPFFIGDQPSGTQVSGYLDAWTPATSAWAIPARSAADVAAAVAFARRHNLRLVVKGGAHSYLGTSNAPDSLMIWTRPTRQVKLHDAFLPKGAPDSTAAVPAVSAGAGATWIDLYDAVTTRAGRYVQGGGCTTVGVAGHVQSGGFGSFSKGFGTSSSNLLEAEVVTAEGIIRSVNAHQNPDLFWALKGGGGGSLGVITRVTFRTHELPANFGYASWRIKASSDEAFRRLVSRFLEFYAENLLNPHWGEQAAIQSDNVLKISMVSQGLDAARSSEVWRPFIAWVASDRAAFSTLSGPEIGVGPARGWWDVEGMRRAKSRSMRYDERPGASPAHGWWSGDQDQVSAFLHGYDSIWLSAALLAPPARDRLTEALVAASRHFAVQLHFNKGLAGGPPEVVADARDTAMSPDALDAFALAIIATGGLPPFMSLLGMKPDLAFARRNAAAVAASAAALRAIAPTSGSYLSESNYFNADWRRAYWGDNYPRLRRVKAKYDPDGLFIVHHGVGSEDWSPDGFERLT